MCNVLQLPLTAAELIPLLLVKQVQLLLLYVTSHCPTTIIDFNPLAPIPMLQPCTVSCYLVRATLYGSALTCPRLVFARLQSARHLALSGGVARCRHNPCHPRGS
jgi:hypothetical protein